MANKPVICPSCFFLIAAPGDATLEVCPRCGKSLTAPSAPATVKDEDWDFPDSVGDQPLIRDTLPSIPDEVLLEATKPTSTTNKAVNEAKLTLPAIPDKILSETTSRPAFPASVSTVEAKLARIQLKRTPLAPEERTPIREINRAADSGKQPNKTIPLASAASSIDRESASNKGKATDPATVSSNFKVGVATGNRNPKSNPHQTTLTGKPPPPPISIVRVGREFHQAIGAAPAIENSNQDPVFSLEDIISNENNSPSASEDPVHCVSQPLIDYKEDSFTPLVVPSKTGPNPDHQPPQKLRSDSAQQSEAPLHLADMAIQVFIPESPIKEIVLSPTGNVDPGAKRYKSGKTLELTPLFDPTFNNMDVPKTASTSPRIPSRQYGNALRQNAGSKSFSRMWLLMIGGAVLLVSVGSALFFFLR